MFNFERWNWKDNLESIMEKSVVWRIESETSGKIRLTCRTWGKKDNLVSLEYSIAFCIFITLILQSKIICQQECREKRTIVQYWHEWKLVQPIWKIACRVLKKNGAIIWFSKITSEHIFKGNKIMISKTQLHFHENWSIIHNSQDMEIPKRLSVNKWMDKENEVHLQTHFRDISGSWQ